MWGVMEESRGKRVRREVARNQQQPPMQQLMRGGGRGSGMQVGGGGGWGWGRGRAFEAVV